MNGGPHFQLSPAISFFVNCRTQKELDELWDRLSTGGVIKQCGWLRDRYGVSWQIVPTVLLEMLGDRVPARRRRVMEAMLRMKKLDIAELKKAYGPAVKVRRR